MRYVRVSAISSSANVSKREPRSTSVTRTPSAAKVQAYSRPIAPAPTTVSVRGSSGRFSTSSLTKISRPSA